MERSGEFTTVCSVLKICNSKLGWAHTSGALSYNNLPLYHFSLVTFRFNISRYFTGPLNFIKSFSTIPLHFHQPIQLYEVKKPMYFMCWLHCSFTCILLITAHVLISTQSEKIMALRLLKDLEFLKKYFKSSFNLNSSWKLAKPVFLKASA